jgi:hypothetical protein
VYLAAGVWPFEGIFVWALDAETGRPVWLNDGCGSLYLEHPHAAMAFGGPSPQGYLLIRGGELVVPHPLQVQRFRQFLRGIRPAARVATPHWPVGSRDRRNSRDPSPGQQEDHPGQADHGLKETRTRAEREHHHDSLNSRDANHSRGRVSPRRESVFRQAQRPQSTNNRDPRRVAP